MKKKRCWKIIIFVSAFIEKERTNFGNKKCHGEVKGHGVSPPFQRKIFGNLFRGRFFSAKETRITRAPFHSVHRLVV